MHGTHDDLRNILRRIDGRGYPAYRELRGTWNLPAYTLEVRRVQGDPFAAPTRVAVVLDPARAGHDAATLSTPSRRTGLSCLLARTFAAAARRVRRGSGSGGSGSVAMVDPGQVVLPNTAVLVGADGAIEARFTIGLPAAGRRILGRAAERLLLDTLPALVESTLPRRAHDRRDPGPRTPTSTKTPTSCAASWTTAASSPSSPTVPSCPGGAGSTTGRSRRRPRRRPSSPRPGSASPSTAPTPRRSRAWGSRAA